MSRRAVAAAVAGETAYRAVRMQSLRRGNLARRQALPSSPPEARVEAPTPPPAAPAPAPAEAPTPKKKKSMWGKLRAAVSMSPKKKSPKKSPARRPPGAWRSRRRPQGDDSGPQPQPRRRQRIAAAGRRHVGPDHATSAEAPPPPEPATPPRAAATSDPTTPPHAEAQTTPRVDEPPPEKATPPSKARRHGPRRARQGRRRCRSGRRDRRRGRRRAGIRRPGRAARRTTSPRANTHSRRRPSARHRARLRERRPARRAARREADDDAGADATTRRRRGAPALVGRCAPSASSTAPSSPGRAALVAAIDHELRLQRRGLEEVAAGVRALRRRARGTASQRRPSTRAAPPSRAARRTLSKALERATDPEKAAASRATSTRRLHLRSLEFAAARADRALVVNYLVFLLPRRTRPGRPRSTAR